MRSTITFTVTGSTRGQLKTRALETYRSLVGDPEAEFPSGATLDISPDEVILAGDGSIQDTRWEGYFSATTNDDGPTR